MQIEAGVDKRSSGTPATTEESREELTRLLVDSEFHCSDRNKRFLQFVSEKLFDGQEATVKAYTIAVDVFGRSADFDPAVDPIVRIEATRLRSSLTRYYELNGDRTAVRINLPAGRYIPEFVSTGAPSHPELQGPKPAARGPTSGSLGRDFALRRLYPDVRTRWLAAAAGVLGGVLLGASVLWLFYMNRVQMPTISEPPAVAVRLAQADSGAEARVIQLRDALLMALTRFQTLRVSSLDPDEERTRQEPLTVASATDPAKYEISLKYSTATGAPLLWWQVVDKENDEIVKSGIERAPVDADDWSDPFSPFIGHLASHLAGVAGVINSSEVAAETTYPTLGNGCVLRAYLALDSADQASLNAARSCLQQTIALRPGDADAKATLVPVLLGLSDDHGEEALDLANDAAALAPDSARGAYSQMLALYRLGNIEAALASGRRAMRLNPYDMVAVSKLAAILFLTGKWDEALPLLSRIDHEEGTPAGLQTILAFNAYRQGAFEEALRRLRQFNTSKCYLSALLEIAVLGRLGRNTDAESAIARLRRHWPGLEIGFSSRMASRSVAPVLVQSLKTGAELAGLQLH